MKRVLCAVVLILTAVLAFVPQTTHAAPHALPPGFSRIELGAGLVEPTAMAFVGNRIFVTQKGGAIRVIRPDGTLRRKPLTKLSVDTYSERGLLGIAIDPNYATNGNIYVYYTTGPGAKNYSGIVNRVSRLKKRANAPGFAERILLDRIPSTNGNHNGGDIHVGFDGKLYISVGESGCCPDDAQGLNTLRGKILRIKRNGKIPADNPFYNTAGARKEIYAFGFRNPWRFGLRASNQTYIVADVGQHLWEEIDSLQEGKNYGWPLYEGPCPYPPDPQQACNPNSTNFGSTIKPIHWYNHNGSGETGNVIAGGVFAENSNYPARYANAYFYGDMGRGWVHVLTMDDNNAVTGSYEFDEDVNSPVSFAHGADGAVYVVSHFGGVIFKYVYTP